MSKSGGLRNGSTTTTTTNGIGTVCVTLQLQLHFHPGLRREFLAEDSLERFPVLGKLLDAFVQLVNSHLVLEDGPAEFRFVVDEGDLFDGLEVGGYHG